MPVKAISALRHTPQLMLNQPILPPLRLDSADIVRFSSTAPPLRRTLPIQVEIQSMQLSTQSTDERAIVVDRVTLKQGDVTAKLSLYHSGPDVRLMDPSQPTMLYIPGIDVGKDENPFAQADKGMHMNHVTLDRQYVDAHQQIHIPSAQGLMDQARLALTWLNSTMKAPVSLAGFSLGGHIAARLASEQPQHVRSVHMMSPTFMSSGSHWAFMTVINPLLLKGMTLYNRVRTALGKPLIPSMSRHTLREISALAAPRDHVGIFEGIRAPIHLSIGSKEPFSASYFQSLLKHSPAVAKQFDIIPGEGHSISKPERLDSTLRFHQLYA